MKTLSEYEKENRLSLENFVQNQISKYQEQTSEIDVIKKFINKVDTNKEVSINSSFVSLFEILTSGKYLNIYELGYTLDYIKSRYNKYGNYYFKFERFNELFDSRNIMKYGSLNLGNMGNDYIGFGSGSICMVLKENFIKKLESIICLKRFSLNYLDSKGNFREKIFKKEISNWSNVASLAFYKHKDDIHSIEERKWANMISCQRGWLEIMIPGDILIKNFKEVRIKTELLEHFLRLNDTENRFLDEMDVLLKYQFKGIVDICKANKINIIGK